jgi:hypothetical protein
MVSDVQAVTLARQRSCLYTLHLLPCSTYLQRMGTGRATQAPNPQQYRGDLAGGRGIFLPLSVLTRLPTIVPQSCLSRNHIGTADSDTGAKAKGAKGPVLRDLPGLCADNQKRTGVARIEESAGPEPQGVGSTNSSTYGDIFPPRVFLAQCNAPRLGSIP